MVALQEEHFILTTNKKEKILECLQRNSTQLKVCMSFIIKVSREEERRRKQQ